MVAWGGDKCAAAARGGGQNRRGQGQEGGEGVDVEGRAPPPSLFYERLQLVRECRSGV